MELTPLLQALWPYTPIDHALRLLGVVLVLGFCGWFHAWRGWRRYHRSYYLRKYRSLKRIVKLSGNEFELLCAELFGRQGWRVRPNAKRGADGGIDLRMKKRGKRAMVQCKCYEKTPVTIQVLREMQGVFMDDGKFDRLYIVTSSSFTRECFSYAQKRKHMELITGKQLVGLIEKYR